MNYRTVIKMRNGRAVAPTPAQDSLKSARLTRAQRAKGKPHLTVVVQAKIDGAWEDYE